MPPVMPHKIAYILDYPADGPDPRWLDWLVDLGYTGIYIEADPLAPIRAGNISQFHDLYRLLFLYDLAWGPRRQELRDWVNQASERCHARGLKTYLGIWEPRLPLEAWGLLPPEWRGRGGYEPTGRNPISWCLSQPQARAAFEQMVVDALAPLRGMDGLKMGTHDSNAHLCNADCPRCREISDEQQMARLFRSLIRGVDGAGMHRPDFDYVLYTWWWTPGSVAAVTAELAGRRMTVLSRSTQNLPQYWQGKELGRVFDLSLGLRGMSSEFANLAQEGRRHGFALADMTAFGHAIEYYWLPYTPAPNRVAQRIALLRQAGSSGWFDYDCGGVYPGINTQIIRGDSRQQADDPQQLVEQTLARLYPAHELAGAAHAYQLAEAALDARPIAFTPPDVACMSGRNFMEAVIALPFDPQDISGFDQQHRLYWFAPSNFLTPASLPTLLEMNQACAALWLQAAQAIAPLRGQGDWAERELPWEKQVFQAHALTSGSVVRYLQMATNRLARAAGTCTGEEERQALISLLEQEFAAASQFAQLWRSDRRLLGNPLFRLSRHLQHCQPWRPIDLDDPFITKLAHTRQMLADLRAGRGLDALPSFVPAPAT